MKTETPARDPAWRTASFDGARREQLRRWSRLPLEDMLRAIEEMGDIAAEFEKGRGSSSPTQARGRRS